MIDLRFPIGGVVRRYGFQQQPPFTTPDAKNVRPDGALLSRTRGGSRPGIGPAVAFDEDYTGNPIRMLSSLRVMSDVSDYSGFRIWSDDFEFGDLSDLWTEITDVSSLADGFVYVDGDTSTAEVMRDAFSPAIHNASGYNHVVEMFIVPKDQVHAGEYRLFLRTEAADPTDEGIIVTLRFDDAGLFGGHVKYYHTGSVVDTDYFGSFDVLAATGEVTGTMEAIANFEEVSGLVTGHKAANSDIVWAISDSGNDGLLVALESDGTLRQVYDLTAVATNVDWEDLGAATVGGVNYLYIADVGDNIHDRDGTTRDRPCIYRVVEPTVPAVGGDTIEVDAADITKIVFGYPPTPVGEGADAQRDVETLLVDPDTGDMYLMTKRTDEAQIWRIEHKESPPTVDVAEHLGNNANITPAISDEVFHLVGGDISRDGRRILYKTRENVYYVWRKVDETLTVALTRLWDGVFSEYVEEDKGESLAWTYEQTGFYCTSDDDAEPDVYLYSGGSGVFDGDGYSAAGWFSVLFENDGTEKVSVFWRGELLLADSTNGGTGVDAGVRVGFGMHCTSLDDDNKCQIDRFRVQYRENSYEYRPRDLLVASQDGRIFVGHHAGIMQRLSATQYLASDRRIHVAQQAGLLYMADYGTLYKADNGALSTKALTSGATNFATLGVTAANHIVVITEGGTGATIGTYKIASVVTTTITLSEDPGDATGVDFHVVRSLKVYDPGAGTVAELEAAAGYVPVGCPCICHWRGRLVLAGAEHEPHLWHMSRSGDPTDWDNAADADDFLRAVSGGNADVLELPDHITAVIPHNDECLIFGCKSSVWIMRGDPCDNGRLTALSEQVGVLSQSAWCYGRNSELYFLTLDGLYMMPAPCGGFPESLSREVLPDEMLDLNPELVEAELAYDFRARGIHIFLSYKDGSSNTHWWFDLETKGFWPMEYDNDHEPTAVFEWQCDEAPEESCVLMGGRDGIIRRHHRYHDQDDGANPIDAYVVYGPIRLGDGHREGVVMELAGSTVENSGDVDWALRVGNTAEAAFNAGDAVTGSWDTAGRNHTDYPRRRGAAYCLELREGAAAPWSVEEVQMVTHIVGRRRV